MHASFDRSADIFAGRFPVKEAYSILCSVPPDSSPRGAFAAACRGRLPRAGYPHVLSRTHPTLDVRRLPISTGYTTVIVKRRGSSQDETSVTRWDGIVYSDSSRFDAGQGRLQALVVTFSIMLCGELRASCTDQPCKQPA